MSSRPDKNSQITSSHHEDRRDQPDNDLKRTKHLGIQDAAQTSTEAEHDLSLRQAIRLYPKAIGWCLIICLSIIMEGYEVGLVPGLWAQDAFRRNYGRQLATGRWEIESKWQSASTAAVQAGSILGYIVSGVVIDRYGYKKTLTVCMISIICFIFPVFFAPSISVLVVGQGLLGVPWGIIQTLTTTYAAEVTPIGLRAYLTSYINLCWVMGGFLGTGVLRAVVDIDTEWAYRIPFAIQWVWPLPIMLAVAFAPDSPWWFVRHGRLDEARKALLALTSPRHVAYDVDANLAMIQHVIKMEQEANTGTSYMDCFRGVDLRRLEIVCVAGAIPLLSGSPFAGNSVYFLESAGLPGSQAYSLGLGQTGISFIGVLAAWVLLHRFGRRTLYLFGLSAVCVIMLIIGILGLVSRADTKILWASGTLLVVFQLIYSAALGPVAYVIVAEIPAAQLRNKTVALARIFLNLGNFGNSFLLPAMLNPGSWNLQGRGALVYFGMGVMTLLWVVFRLPEAKGRSYGELDNLFMRRIAARKFKDTLAENAAISSKKEVC